MPIGITLILIVYNEQQFDVRILNLLLIARYHLIGKETYFLVVIANLCYYKFASIKNEINKMLYYNSIHFIQSNMVTNRFQLLIYHQISSNFLIRKIFEVTNLVSHRKLYGGFLCVHAYLSYCVWENIYHTWVTYVDTGTDTCTDIATDRWIQTQGHGHATQHATPQVGGSSWESCSYATFNSFIV